MSEIEHPNLAVMFTDIKGYSRLMSEDEAGALKLLAEHNDIMESSIAAHEGKIVKMLGDSYMVIFNDAFAAVNCGLQALSKIAARNLQSKPAFEIRVGIHAGAMLEREGDFFGENVNIAARLEQLTAPMTIAASERALQEVATRIKAEARFAGAQSLKNLRYPVSVYTITPADAWKLYLSLDATTADTEHADVLGDITTAEVAWGRVEELAHKGDLQNAAQLAEAALSKFGGTYANYAHLATLYLVARMETEARSTLKMGEMLAQKSDDDEQFSWLQNLVNMPAEALKHSSDELTECMTDAQAYITQHPEDLEACLHIESIKARLTGHMGGLSTLVQQHQNSALVLRGYAESLRDQNSLSDANSMLEQAISVSPQVADHQLRRVQWMVDDDDLESVLDESAKLAQKFPYDSRVYQWTGKTRLLNLDPFGAQWIFEQAQELHGAQRIDSTGWLICSLMQQGRLDKAVELARKSMRNAIRQNLHGIARIYLWLATAGMYLQHWENVLEILEEYRRFDADWLMPKAAVIVAKHNRKLIPWDHTMTQLGELALSSIPSEYPHPSGLTALSLLPAVQDADHWKELHQLEFFRSHRDWIIETRQLNAAAMEARGALMFHTLDTWHLQLVPILTRLQNRLDHRLPSLLALAGLIQAKLNDFEGGKGHLEQARKLWRNADWPVWEIQEAESALAAGATSNMGQDQQAGTNTPSE